MSTPVQAYFDRLPPLRRSRLESLRDLILSRYPGAELSMKYRMPTFSIGGGWLAIANQKPYISVYTCSFDKIQGYVEKHLEIKCGKGCLNFRDNNDLHMEDLQGVIDNTLGA